MSTFKEAIDRLTQLENERSHNVRRVASLNTSTLLLRQNVNKLSEELAASDVNVDALKRDVHVLKAEAEKAEQRFGTSLCRRNKAEGEVAVIRRDAASLRSALAAERGRIVALRLENDKLRDVIIFGRLGRV